MSILTMTNEEITRRRVVSDFKSSGDNLTMGGTNYNARSRAYIKVSNILAERAEADAVKEVWEH